jgi:hypothetical protein
MLTCMSLATWFCAKGIFGACLVLRALEARALAFITMNGAGFRGEPLTLHGPAFAASTRSPAMATSISSLKRPNLTRPASYAACITRYIQQLYTALKHWLQGIQIPNLEASCCQ